MLNIYLLTMINSLINKNNYYSFNTMFNKIGLTYFTLWGIWGGTIIYTKSILYFNKNYKVQYNALLHSGIIGGFVSYYTYHKLFLT